MRPLTCSPSTRAVNSDLMREAGALSSIAPSVDPRGAAEVNKGAQFCDNAVTWCAVYDRAGRRRATGPWCAQGVWGHASDERCARLIPKYLTASCRAWHDRDSPQMGPCGGKRQRCPEGRRCLRPHLLPQEALCFAYLLPHCGSMMPLCAMAQKPARSYAPACGGAVVRAGRGESAAEVLRAVGWPGDLLPDGGRACA